MDREKAFFLHHRDAKKSGIYRITINRGGDGPPRFYIGQAVYISKRWASHLNLLRKGTHWNGDFQYDFKRYGESSITFEIVLICQRDAEVLCFYEQKIIDIFDRDQLYNLWIKCVKTGAGHRASAARKARISAKLRGIKRSEETKAAIGRAQAWKHTIEGKEKMKAAARKRPKIMSDAERAYRSETTSFRRLPPEAYKKAIDTKRMNRLVLQKNSAWVLQ